MNWWAFHDSNPERRRYTKLTSVDEAKEYNSQGFGIFYAVNEFDGDRKIDNLKNICSWYVDLDDHQPPLDQIIKVSPMYPSSVTFTKRGVHIIFHAKNASMLHYKMINKRLLHMFGGKTSVFDVARLLRVPGFFHMKEPANPYLVKRVFEADFVYSEEQMLGILKPHPDERKVLEETKAVFIKASDSGGDYFSKIHEADQEELLSRLSGKACVYYERYSFRRAGKNKNILVNGKGTSCFIDHQKRIGGHVGGGFPSVYEWLRYYGYSHKEVMEILKQEIGDL